MCALFVLRHILADRTLDQFAAHQSAKTSALYVALAILSSSELTFTVQNAATQLFAVLLDGVLKRNADDSALDFGTFALMNPRTAELIVEILTLHQHGASAAARDGLYAVLILLSRLSPFAESVGSAPRVVSLASAIAMSSADQRIRQMAARTVAGLLPLGAVSRTLDALTERARAQSLRRNEMHGLLLQLAHIARRLQLELVHCMSVPLDNGKIVTCRSAAGHLRGVEDELQRLATASDEPATTRQEAIAVLHETRVLVAKLTRACSPSAAAALSEEQQLVDAHLSAATDAAFAGECLEKERRGLGAGLCASPLVDFAAQVCIRAHMATLAAADAACGETEDALAHVEAALAHSEAVVRSAAHHEVWRAVDDGARLGRAIAMRLWNAVCSSLLAHSQTRQRGGTSARLLRRCTRAWTALTLSLPRPALLEIEEQNLSGVWQHLALCWAHHRGSRARCCFVEAAGCVVGIWAMQLGTRDVDATLAHGSFAAASRFWRDAVAVACDPACAEKMRLSCVASFKHCAAIFRGEARATSGVVEWWPWDEFLVLLHDESCDIRCDAASVARALCLGLGFVGAAAKSEVPSFPMLVEAELWRLLCRSPTGRRAVCRLAAGEVEAHAAIVRTACGPGGWIANAASGADAGAEEEEAFPEEAVNEWKESLIVAETLARTLADEEDALRSVADDALRFLAPHEATLRTTFAWDFRRTVVSTSVACLRYFTEVERA